MRRAALLLMAAGTSASVILLAFVHSRLAEASYAFAGTRLAWALAFSCALLVAAYAVGLPDVVDRNRQLAAAAVGSVTGGAIAISAAQLLLGAPLLPRFVVFGSAPLVIVWLSICNLAVRRGRVRAQDRDQVLIVGCGEDVADVARLLADAPERPAEVVAVLAPEDVRSSRGEHSLMHQAERLGATLVVLDRNAQSDGAVVDQAARLHESGVRVRTLSLFYEFWLGRLPVGELERTSLMFDIGEVHRARFARQKRLIDIFTVVVLSPALLLAVPVVLIGNRLANPGPLLFRQTRVGKGGACFQILKFRTMREAVEVPDGSEWAALDDERVTSFGLWLRRSHVDELPQLVNVLRGELSMVGPRPEQPHYVAQLSEKLPFYDLRHLVQPGLTGWAQVNLGYAASAGEALEKLQYEFWYLRHQRLAVDIRILARTVRSVIGRDGR